MTNITSILERYIITIGWLLFAAAILLHTSSCQTYDGEDREDGKYRQSGLRLDLPGNKLDMDILSHRVRILSPEEHKEEMRRKAEDERLATELDAEKRERLYKIETKEKKRRVLLIMSCICYGLAVLAVIAGVLLEGWKTFGIIAVAMMAFGIFFMCLIDMLPMFTLIIMLPVGAGILRLLYVLKHVALNKKIKPTE